MIRTMGTAMLKAGKKIDVIDTDGKNTEYSATNIIIATGARSRHYQTFHKMERRLLVIEKL